LENSICLENCVYIQQEVEKRFVVSKGDLLIALSGATTGKMGTYNLDDIAYLNQRVGNLKVINKNVMLPAYRDVFMRSKTEDILKLAYGGAQPNISGSIIGDFTLLLPPFHEQQRIVAEIEKWFALIGQIEQGKADIQATIKQAKSKILDLAIHGNLVPQDPNDEPTIELLKRINPDFTPCDNGHYEQLPQGWTTIKVGDVANYINGRAFKPEEWEQEGLPIIRIQNLNDKNASYNRTTETFESKYLIHSGDLLFAWAASLGTYIWNGNDAWLNQHIFKVEPYLFIEKQYLYYVFEAMTTEFYTQSHGSGMVHITKKQFEDIELLLPPLEEQKRIIQAIKLISIRLDLIMEGL